MGQGFVAGCSAAWLARLTGGQKVGGSNPLSPTIFKKEAHRFGDGLFLWIRFFLYFVDASEDPGLGKLDLALPFYARAANQPCFPGSFRRLEERCHFNGLVS